MSEMRPTRGDGAGVEQVALHDDDGSANAGSGADRIVERRPADT
jgi:hypothetical protein